MGRRKSKWIWCILLWLVWMTASLSGCGKKENAEPISCSISISCETILANKDKLKTGKEEYVPADGWILQEQEIELADGSTVFDLLKAACRQAGIHMEFSESPGYKSTYIEGINQIYELDCGASSGWMYRVNDEYPNYGTNRCKLNAGDKVEFVYTCELGADVGKEME